MDEKELAEVNLYFNIFCQNKSCSIVELNENQLNLLKSKITNLGKDFEVNKGMLVEITRKWSMSNNDMIL